MDKYAPDQARQRASIPKWQVQNTAFASIYADLRFEQVLQSSEIWGRYVETAIYFHLVRAARLGQINVFYWREGNDELDFVISRNSKIIKIGVKSGRTQRSVGMAAFQKKIRHDKVLIVGNSGILWQ